MAPAWGPGCAVPWVASPGVEGRLDGLAGFPADGFVGFGVGLRVGAGILGGEIREKFFHILETAPKPERIVFPHSRRELGGETTDEVRMLPEFGFQFKRLMRAKRTGESSREEPTLYGKGVLQQ